MSNLSTRIAHTHPTRRTDTAPVAWAGLGFVVSVLVSVLAFPAAPGSASPAADLQRYYEQHNTIDVLSDLWSVAGVCILLVFLSGLATTAERRGHATAARVVAGAGVCGVACEALASAVELALATSVVHRHDPTLVAGLYSV